MSKKNKDKKKGGFGKFVVLMSLLVAAGGFAFWFVAPEDFNEQVGRVRGLWGG